MENTRDFFAGQALQAYVLLLDPLSPASDHIDKTRLARWCYELADVMIVERKTRMKLDHPVASV